MSVHQRHDVARRAPPGDGWEESMSLNDKQDTVEKARKAPVEDDGA